MALSEVQKGTRFVLCLALFTCGLYLWKPTPKDPETIRKDACVELLDKVWLKIEIDSRLHGDSNATRQELVSQSQQYIVNGRTPSLYVGMLVRSFYSGHLPCLSNDLDVPAGRADLQEHEREKQAQGREARKPAAPGGGLCAALGGCANFQPPVLTTIKPYPLTTRENCGSGNAPVEWSDGSCRANSSMPDGSGVPAGGFVGQSPQQ